MVTSRVISYSLVPDGDLHLDRVAFLVIEEALPDRRRRRDPADRGIRLLGGDDLEDRLFPVPGVAYVHGGAETDLAPRDLVEVHEGEGGHAAVELADAGLQEALALLGRLVFRVLTKVTVLPGLQDLLGEMHLQLVVERPDLLLEPLLDLHHPRSRLVNTHNIMAFAHGIRFRADPEPHQCPLSALPPAQGARKRRSVSSRRSKAPPGGTLRGSRCRRGRHLPQSRVRRAPGLDPPHSLGARRPPPADGPVAGRVLVGSGD